MSLDSTKLPDPPMSCHTFTIYHRHVFEKSNFKDYDSLLESRIARCHARASYLASIFYDGNDVVTPNDNQNDANAGLTRQQDAQGGKIRELVPKSTDTHCVHGEYIASFFIGTQLIKTYLLIDSVSGLLWWQCGPCEANNCYKQDQPLYNFTTSRTSRKVDCIRHSSYCITADPAFHCDHDTSESIYNKKYTDGPGTKGKGSILSFHISKWPSAISAKLLPNYKYPSFYFVNFYKVFVNEREVPVKSSWWNFKRDMSGGIFVDTGTTFTRFPNDFYVIFRYIFRAAVEDSPMVENPIGPFDTCYKVDPNGEELYFPIVKLYFGSVTRSTELILEQERVIVKYQGFIVWLLLDGKKTTQY
uniref:Protein ASPARTIC PROTEASE IN GUARD CELL 2-like n=1 Tax=Nicotiana tabacum TaxID=4097 RepID=A0A1S4D328_TOBAC|nr:PREDICTED: protein ASPARTIC PROTEASE IN GUARD CELL 2-like [Nicotiana tabacum]